MAVERPGKFLLLCFVVSIALAPAPSHNLTKIFSIFKQTGREEDQWKEQRLALAPAKECGTADYEGHGRRPWTGWLRRARMRKEQTRQAPFFLSLLVFVPFPSTLSHNPAKIIYFPNKREARPTDGRMEGQEVANEFGHSSRWDGCGRDS